MTRSGWATAAVWATLCWCMLLVVCGCGLPEESDEASAYAELKSRVRSALSYAGDLTNPLDLLHAEAFHVRGGLGDVHVRAALELVAGGELTAEERQVIAMMMYALPEARYLEYCRQLVLRAEGGRVDPLALRAALFPMPEFTTVIQRNYGNPVVQALLASSAVRAAGLEDTAAFTLSGAWWTRTQEELRYGEARPPAFP